MQRLYNESGGFSEYLYHQVGETIVASNGVEGKIVEKIDKASYDGLPILSNTSEVYFKTNANGEIIQARIYKDRKPVCDFDWDHNHTNKMAKNLRKGLFMYNPLRRMPKVTGKEMTNTLDTFPMRKLSATGN